MDVETDGKGIKFFCFISPWLDAMKSIFIANLSTPQKKRAENTEADTRQQQQQW